MHGTLLAGRTARIIEKHYDRSAATLNFAFRIPPFALRIKPLSAITHIRKKALPNRTGTAALLHVSFTEEGDYF